MTPVHEPTRFPSHLIEDVRFAHPVSGRRARRLVYAVAPRCAAMDWCETVGVFLASGAARAE